MVMQTGEKSGTVVAIGNFDGVHRGHRDVLAQVLAIKSARSLSSVVLTFDPHPREVLGGQAPAKLTTIPRRIELLEQCGIDRVVVEPFTRDLASWSPERFVSELLVDRLGAKAVVVGENFRFGAKRAGNFDVLRGYGEKLGFDAVAARVSGDAEGPFSSTRIRRALENGDVVGAAHVLGRWHRISGIVERGDALGRTIGFPTANLGSVEEVLPKNGVYAVRVIRGASGASGKGEPSVLPGVMNIGVRPTVSGTKLRIEVHLLDFDEDLYGETLGVDFVARLRDEMKFDGLPALKAQIAKDVETARAQLRSAPG